MNARDELATGEPPERRERECSDVNEGEHTDEQRTGEQGDGALFRVAGYALGVGLAAGVFSGEVFGDLLGLTALGLAIALVAYGAGRYDGFVQ